MYIITLRQTQFSYIVRMQVAKYQTLEYLISVVKQKYFFKKESIKLGKNCRSYIIKQYLLIITYNDVHQTTFLQKLHIIYINIDSFILIYLQIK